MESKIRQSYSLLTNCNQAEVSPRDEAMFQLNLCNYNAYLEELGTVAALKFKLLQRGGISDPCFIRVYWEIVESEGLNLSGLVVFNS